MSDSTTATPAAPAPAPAAAPAPAPAQPSAAPPAAQPSLSISEAARALRAARQPQARPGQPTAHAPPAAAPAPAPGAAAQPAPPAEAAARPGHDPLDAMARALGLEDGQSRPAEVGTAPSADAYEIEGTRYSREQLRAALGQSADYTRKTQALAEAQRQVQQQQEALSQVLPYIQPELQRLQMQIQGVNRPDPQLLDQDPQRYMRELAVFEQAREEQGRLGQLTQLQQAALERSMAAQVEKSNAVLSEQLPGWSDPKQRGEWQQSIAAWAIDKGGYSKAELNGLADHRHLLALAKSMLWDRMVSGARTSAPAQPPPARGIAPPPAAPARVVDAQRTFDERPNIRNAASLLGARRSNSGNGVAR